VPMRDAPRNTDKGLPASLKLAGPCELDPEP
jgi:hypothetical protein